MKKLLIISILLLFIGSVFWYYNYQQTKFIYTSTIPEWFFDDHRMIFLDDQHSKLQEFMSNEYSDFLLKLWVSENITDDITNAISTWNFDLIASYKEDIAIIEEYYQSVDMLGQLDSILWTGDWGHIQTTWSMADILRDIPDNTKKLVQHISWMMILRCSLMIEPNLCTYYQTIIEDFLQKSDRKWSLSASLINLSNIEYALNSAIIAWVNLDICGDWIDREKKYTIDMVSEFNTSFQILAQWIIEPLKDLSNIKKTIKIQDYVLRNINQELFVETLDHQIQSKWLTLFYNTIQGKDNNQLDIINNTTPFTKILLSSLWIQSEYFIADIISSQLLETLIPSNTIKQRYKTISDLCDK